MEYQTFLSHVKEKLLDELPKGVCVEEYQATKNNGEIHRGLVFQKKRGEICPIIYMEDYYEQYLHGMELSGITDALMEWYDHSQQIPSPIMEAENLKDYEKMKEKIVFRLINQDRNQELLKKVPHLSFMDLDIVFYVLFSAEKYSAISMLITNEHLKLWNITKEDVINKARINTPRLLPAEVQDIQSAIEELFPDHLSNDRMSGYMYVLTNTQRSHGAAAILYPGLLELIGEEWKESFFILPSSIHEVLLIPESKSPGITEMKEAVYSINRTEVSREEFLSDSVYYYNYRKKEVCV